MFQECFLTYYQARCESLEEYFFNASISFDPDAIHDLRVEIKQLRAFFRLIQWITPEFTAKKNIRNIRKLFKAAGNLRDVHVQQELTRSWTKDMGIFLSAYYNTLKQKEFPAREEFAAFAAQFDLTKELEIHKKRLKRVLKSLSASYTAEKMKVRIELQLQQILEYGDGEKQQEGNLHKLRILAKESRYTLDFARQCFPELGYKEELSQKLRRLHQTLGKWHDGDVANEHLQDFNSQWAASRATSENAVLLHESLSLYEQLSVRIQQKRDTHLRSFEESWQEFLSYMKLH